jgi:hypothetical protein
MAPCNGKISPWYTRAVARPRVSQVSLSLDPVAPAAPPSSIPLCHPSSPARLRRPGPTAAPPSSAASARRPVTMAGASWTGLQGGWAGGRSWIPKSPARGDGLLFGPPGGCWSSSAPQAILRAPQRVPRLLLPPPTVDGGQGWPTSITLVDSSANSRSVKVPSFLY